MARPPVEPSADMRRFAHSAREMYVALRAEGFTMSEAMSFICEVIASTRDDE